jgi:tRNA (cmo5U34)-methyltransferase
MNLWRNKDHVLAYLAKADRIPYRTQGEAVLLEFFPASAGRILDIGTGDGRLIEILSTVARDATFVGIDFSQEMLQRARERLRESKSFELRRHDLEQPLPDLGSFDAVVSSFAIHHVADERKQKLYAEVFRSLQPGGVFLNLEHVSSPSEDLHIGFLEKLGVEPKDDDPSNILASVELQLGWLRDIGFRNVDCHWKWRELALLAGEKPR